MANFSPVGKKLVGLDLDGTLTQHKSPLEEANRKALERYRWLLEEYRISLFAQEVKTSEPVSPERLSALWLEAVPGR